MTFQSWKQPIQLSNLKNNYTYRATANQLKSVLYGLKSTEKWPEEGMHKVMHDGIIFWVNPLGKLLPKEGPYWQTVRREGMHSRLMCQCPHCYKTISYGRLHQHLRVHYNETR